MALLLHALKPGHLNRTLHAQASSLGFASELLARETANRIAQQLLGREPFPQDLEPLVAQARAGCALLWQNLGGRDVSAAILGVSPAIIEHFYSS
jgi:hypothetical protein